MRVCRSAPRVAAIVHQRHSGGVEERALEVGDGPLEVMRQRYQPEQAQRRIGRCGDWAAPVARLSVR